MKKQNDEDLNERLHAAHLTLLKVVLSSLPPAGDGSSKYEPPQDLEDAVRLSATLLKERELRERRRTAQT